MSTYDCDLVVVGAGVCGTFAVRQARALGASVVHVAQGGRAHSRAASAIAKPSYLPKAARPQLAATVAAYGHGVTRAGAWVTTYRKPGAPAVWDPACWLIDPDHALDGALPDITAEVLSVGGHSVRLADGSRLRTRAVVLATGAQSRLSPPVGKTTWGVTWVGPVADLADPANLRLHTWAPYKTISAGPVGERCRVGSSSGLTYEAALARGEQLLAIALREGLVRTGAGYSALAGARFKTEEHVQYTGDDVWWVGGHHRNGYALGPVDAAACVRRALETAVGR